MKKLAFTAALFLVISCGGGGGGGGGASAPVTGGGGTGGGGGGTPPPSSSWNSSITTAEANVYRTSEYNSQWSLEAIHAAEAYAVLDKNAKEVAGNGVAIAIIDTGVGIARADIAPNYQAIGSYDFVNSDSDPTDDNGHGTNVASIAAGAKNGFETHGVAYDSEIIGLKVLDSGASNGGQAMGSYADIVLGITQAALDGAGVINLSLGGSSADSGLRSALLVAKAADVLTVSAAGNSTSTQPDYPAYYASDSSLLGYILAVGAVDSSSNIASFSSYCGDTMNYCLVAPGVGIKGAYYLDDLHYTNYSGTSQATPHVAGAAAVIRAAWTFLTAPQVSQILLQTATDLGAAGVDEIYGNGELNLYAAVQAQGSNNFAYGSSVDSGSYDLRYSSMTTSPIFGDAFAQNVVPQLQNAVFFDDFGRDYKANLGDKISAYKPTQQTDLTYLMNNNTSSRILPWRFDKNGKNRINFNLSSYKNSDAPNMFGLKHLVMDRSVDPQRMSTQNSGFSFVSSDVLLKNSSAGFAFNYDEISTKLQKDFGSSGFILKNNFAAAPFQDFMRQGSVNLWHNSRKFNQLFMDQNFLNEKFALKFSYQNSYESAQLGIKGAKQNEMLDLGMMFKTKNDLSFLVSVGNLTEFNNNMLNSRSVGAFESVGNVKTSYAKITVAKKFFEDFQIIASISEGISKINGNQVGIFRSFDNVRSRSASLALIRDNFMNGQIGLSYVEPMRVYQGSANFDIAVARDNAGNLTRYQGSASLAPKGREQDFEIFYLRNLGNFSNLKMNFLMQKEMANIKNYPTNYLGFVSYSKKF